MQKLYGHGNDVFALAACPQGSCLVSASKAQSAIAADIRVWDIHAAEPCIQQLPGHTLTVTQLSFSQDGRFLLSASRDRSFCLFSRASPPAADASAAPDASGNGLFTSVGCKRKAHDRIIWSAAWAPHGRAFATGSRDKVLKVWPFDPDQPEVPAAPVVSWTGLRAAVTAVAYAPVPCGDGRDVLAVGYEDGQLELVAVATADSEPRLDRVRPSILFAVNVL